MSLQIYGWIFFQVRGKQKACSSACGRSSTKYQEKYCLHFQIISKGRWNSSVWLQRLIWASCACSHHQRPQNKSKVTYFSMSDGPFLRGPLTSFTSPWFVIQWSPSSTLFRWRSPRSWRPVRIWSLPAASVSPRCCSRSSRSGWSSCRCCRRSMRSWAGPCGRGPRGPGCGLWRRTAGPGWGGCGGSGTDACAGWIYLEGRHLRDGRRQSGTLTSPTSGLPPLEGAVATLITQQSLSHIWVNDLQGLIYFGLVSTNFK